MSIPEEIVRKTAQLARLSIETKEMPRLVRDISEILEYVERLEILLKEETGRKESRHTSEARQRPAGEDGGWEEPEGEAAARFRADEAEPWPDAERALADAPDSRGGFFRVPSPFSGE